MAKKKKSQVPPPPRPVQAPKKRTDEARTKKTTSGAGSAGGNRSKLLIAAVVGALVVAGAAVGIALAVSGSGDSLAEETAAAGCTVETFPSMGRQHVTKRNPSFDYNSSPPTSGPHYPEPAIWNVYTEPIEQILLIHNLEHGGIAIQYGEDVSDAEVQRIVDWYKPDPNGIVVAPLPRLGSKIAVTAWTHLMTCSNGFDEQAFASFRDAYRFKGPEQFPPEALTPGANQGFMQPNGSSG